ncbi:uncharacterized protein LOC129959341 [Argiope bruennichi]|uniref:uncharacterized protein LOC129959341 n=1 Tax=Argiope bruennichi TaxID=94029 RepID=UPI002494D283|nr:uncharacterized protein LOC129959341 [Argiope bruennichi]
MEGEIELGEDYKDKAIELTSKLERQIENLRDIPQNHIRKSCNSNYQCKLCGSFSHNSLICEGQQPDTVTKNISPPVEEGTSIPKENNTASTMVSFSTEQNKRKNRVLGSVLLQTFSAVVTGRRGSRTHLRCMLDCGANKSFILRGVVEELGLKTVGREVLAIHTFGSKTAERRAYNIVEITLRNVQHPTRCVKIQAVVNDPITSAKIHTPSQFVRNIALEKGIELADVSTSEGIDVLIGSDYISEILGERNIRISKRLIAADSIFGYLLLGKEMGIDCKEISANHLIAEGEESSFDRVKDLWLLETIGINMDKEVSLSDKETFKSFQQNTTYKDKRYETRLLWKEDNKALRSNYEIAKRRLFGLSKTLNKNKELFVKYDGIIKEHLREGIIERVDLNLDQNINTGYFLPHHAVVRERKDSTKVRIVFDASSKGKGALSLNDCLESGPNLNPDLLEILLRFRLNKIAFSADIQLAFLEVRIAEEDRQFLKFLWIKEDCPNPGFSPHNIETFQYKRVTFGVKCSPFLLAAVIKLHLEKFESEYEEACKMLSYLYVDDLAAGTSSASEAIKLSKEMIYILSQASMNLRRWATNSSILNEAWKQANVDRRETSEELGVPLKILGLIWDNINDKFTIDIHQISKMKDSNLSKRLILSICGMLFDPLGMITPFTVRMKLLLQNTWERELKWDEPLPPDIQETFLSWLDEVKTIPQISLPRPYFLDAETPMAEIHIFSDASPKAYGCVAYFRKVINGKVNSSFIVAKCRLAPLKKLSLPRLELMGALVSARLAEYLKRAFPWITSDHIFFWSDSQISLHRIKGDPLRWKEFVRNRVREIQEKTNRDQWNYCRGKTNPADKLTRGLSIRVLAQDDVWWHGPDWLFNPDLCLDDTVSSEFNEIEVANELKKGYVPASNLVMTVTGTNCDDFLDKLLKITNDYVKLICIISYILRFSANCRYSQSRTAGPITADERIQAENQLIRMVQLGKFKEEIRDLKRALHLDFVTDQTSDCFIASLKRFFGRRGKCAKILTDNSKTFVGANKELKRLYNLVNSPDQCLSEFLISESIEWQFIPPKSPNFGGGNYGEMVAVKR